MDGGVLAGQQVGRVHCGAALLRTWVCLHFYTPLVQVQVKVQVPLLGGRVKTLSKWGILSVIISGGHSHKV